MSVQVIGSGTIGGIDEGLVVSGIVTATELDISGDIDVDGHTNLDNVSVGGATTCNGGAVFLNSISLNASTNNYLYFDDILNFTRNGHGAEMIIDGSGRVGVNYNDSTNSWGANFRVGGLLLSDQGSGSPYVFGKLASAQDFVIGRTDPGGSFNSEHLRIKAGGDVGIGTNSPIERLHVHKPSATGPFMYITNTSTGVSASDGIQIGYDGTNTAVFKNNEPTDSVFYAGSQSFRITSSGHVLPDVNNTQDLGSSSKRWRNVYTTDLQLSNKGKTNDVDNTWGDYTIQEGESDLFLINNRNGKKYKFNLTEVS